MEIGLEYVFPSIRGVQAQHEYYVAMLPLRLIPKLLLFDDHELPADLRAQRVLSKSRIPEMTKYILDNPDDYVFSAITASIDADVRFEPVVSSSNDKLIGCLHVPMSAKFIINDGQHRQAAIGEALKENPDLGDQSIAVVLFVDIGLKRCQQMFADLNRYAVRPSRSLGLLYDHRDDNAITAKKVAFSSSVFSNVVEMEKSSLSSRSRKLFTFSAIYTGTSALLKNLNGGQSENLTDLAILFWEEVAKQFPEWRMVREGKISAGEVREGFIHSHGITLHALGKLGNELLRKEPKTWKKIVKKLNKIDWARSNARIWEGRSMLAGKLVKSEKNVILTTNIIKKELGLSLTPDEITVEDAFLRGINGQ